MSLRPTENKDPGYNLMEAPPTDSELKTKEANSILYRLLIFILIDYILTVLIIIYRCNIFSDKENDIMLLIIELISVTVCYILIYVSLFLKKHQLGKIIRYIYLFTIVILYFAYEFIMTLINFINNFPEINWVDIVFLIIAPLTLPPRILFFYYTGPLIIKISEIDDIKKGEEQDKFRNDLENKMGRDDTDWSKISLGGKTNKTVNESKNLNNNSIKEKVNEEENEDENL